MKTEGKLSSVFFLSLFFLTGCSYNPFISNNHTTGSPASTLVGAGVGAGGIALLGGSKPLIVLGGLGGGAVGYYVSTLRYDSGGIIQAGGQVYQVGDVVGIYIPSDKLFEPNTAEFLPQAGPILDSTATVLKRFPDNNIIISGNTSGFYRSKREQILSEKRAQRVSAYLWNKGINQFNKDSIETDRQLNYVGYGDYFPIAANLTNEGIRANSRIQITSYPSDCDLGLDKRQVAVRNMGATDTVENDNAIHEARKSCSGYKGEDC